MAQKKLTARHVPIDLPSKCVLYPDVDPSTVYVRPFYLEELDKIRYAQMTAKLRPVVQAIDDTLSISAFDLTVGDFMRLMYWHRLSSYPRRPLSIQWECNNPEHLEKARQLTKSDITLEEGEDYPESVKNMTEDEEEDILEYRKKIKNTFFLTKNSLKVTAITNENLDKAIELMNNFATISSNKDKDGNVVEGTGIYLNIPRMIDIVEQSELQMLNMSKRRKFISDDTTAEDASDYLDTLAELDNTPVTNEIAMHLSKIHGLTLEDRMSFINKRMKDSLEDASMYLVDDSILTAYEEIEHLLDHGVSEVIDTKCGGCGNKASIELPFDYAQFFP